MSLIHLRSPSMIAVFEDFLNSPEKRKIFESDPMVAPLLGPIESANRDLIRLTQQEGEAARELKEISDELAERSERHNAICRALDAGFTFARHLCETLREQRPIEAARAVVLPDGLSVITSTYRDQAGHALRVEDRLNASLRDTLGRVVFDGEDLNALVDEYVAIGLRMNTLVARRAELQGEDDTTRVSANDLRQARYQWLKVTNSLLSVVEISSLSEGDKRRLLANLHQAQAQAQARKARSSQNTTAEPEAEEKQLEGDTQANIKLLSPPHDDEAAPGRTLPAMDDPSVEPAQPVDQDVHDMN
ncbi:hypothetical protein DL240_14310 [Lujinxingia litoralis]|uniref:Uncharacterized protein n=1 Tax=Lujinxingia litoralis TaxID=2211119 RepID=A0A328C3A6_9DELT|nr:hypothetical protein [Lujinxingia litoralis]RAL21293.1 hypothetical protein DL240_14310 [Lujinxingia litoralis]